MTTTDPSTSIPNHLPTVLVSDTEVLLTGLRTTDRDTIGLLRSVTDPEDTAREALALGSRALLGAVARADGLTLTTAVEQATRLVDETLATTEARFHDITSGLFGDDGALPRTVTDLREAVRGIVAEAFDPERRDSALSRLSVVLAEAETAQLRTLRRALDPDDGDGPLGRMLHGLREQHREQMDALARIAAADAAQAAGVAVWEHTAVKGQTYEQLVVAAVAKESSRWEDVCEPVGRQRGTGGGMTGDVLVEIAGQGRYVVEAKDRRLPLGRALTELRSAMANHEAAAGLLVFSREENCPSPTPFTTYGNLGVVVLSKDTIDPLALRVACAWARTQVVADASASEDLDLPAAISHLDDARRSLAKATDIRKSLGGASRHIQQADQHVEDLRREIGLALTQVRTDLGR